ncbi:unnamed protein product [Alopecurus aequalis]
MNRHGSSLAPAHTLDDENLLEEILLRLPPQPSSLPRTSRVCKRWQTILYDPKFPSRFRKNHQKPPLLGFFATHFGMDPVFTTVLDKPDHIPAARFSVPQKYVQSKQCRLMGCRHGLAILINGYQRQVIVWDPLTGQQHRMPFPLGLCGDGMGSSWRCHAAVLCVDAEYGHMHGDCYLSPFRLVLISSGRNKTFACLYESASGLWANIVSMVTSNVILGTSPSILMWNVVYWLLDGGDILVFDIERQTLGVIEKPARSTSWSFQLLKTHDGTGLVFGVLSKLSLHLWERKISSDGVVRWVLQQEIQLEEMFPHIMPRDDKWVYFVGYDEDTNVIVLSTRIGNFMLQLESMHIKKISEPDNACLVFYPYTNFFTAGREDGWKWLELKF